MSNIDALKKLRMYVANPGVVQELTNQETADILIILLKKINELETKLK